MKKSIVVTGGFGFIGSNIAHSLSKRYDLIVVDIPTLKNIRNLWGVSYTW